MTRLELIRILADGQRHTVDALGERFGLTSEAISREIKALSQWHLTVEQTPGQGYHLPGPLALLMPERIQAALDPAVSDQISSLHVFDVIDSTNVFLSDHGPPLAGRLAVCLAEYQTHGRGRQGHTWSMPFAAGLCLSMSALVVPGREDFSALTLIVGLGVRRALTRFGVADVTVKWPNDLVLREQKLGGILVETQSQPRGLAQIVIGIGINVDQPQMAASGIAMRWGDGPAALSSVVDASPVDRNLLAAHVLSDVAVVLRQFTEHGLGTFAEEWRQADFLHGREVSLNTSDGEHVGTASGIDAVGALLISANGHPRAFRSGEVMLRANG